MSSCLHVIGLGPAGLEQLTLGNYRRICSANKVFARTDQHPCVQELVAEGVCIESFDKIYAKENTFEEVYEKIIEHLRQELSKSPEVIYTVPGHPMVAEKTVQLIGERLAQEYDVVIHPAMSFVDEIFRVLKFDPIDGVSIINYSALKDFEHTGREWLIVPQVYNKLIASEVKLDLMEVYPDDAGVYVVQALGTTYEHIDRLPLYEMDHGEYDHLTTIVLPPNTEVTSFNRLAKVMKTLCSEGGCAWDREQTHESLKKYLIEESYEVIDAIEKQDMYNLCEELGDLLLQVVFHAQIATEAGTFGLKDVLSEVIQKMIRRHPHVFGEERAETADDVIVTWDKIKLKEKQNKAYKESDFFSDPKGLPALMLATSTQRRVGKIGFDWSDIEGPWAKVLEELKELENALVDEVGIREEFGDLLFAVVNLSRFLKLDAEEVLRDTIHKFQRRFLKMVELSKENGIDFELLSLEQMDVFWEKAKSQEKSGNME
ncbi:nucleoside triphosphate pyrophosphohydrolase [Desulfosporosinus hippei]|uniref:Tetrapyrrole methylase family protein / MazG family protein n=1 Tax=Desulfosporosinus hippei DSM 8344 TaxID=1121419 RepID=A0A1G7WW16_9FIRM|nr:nucleoside triphosphate pyrophosphohydrolase [Desulfosporosinus hippei]SDG76125.1 tetrapyrrole methylase family protein / MazG family protein [Desulfosporosinus hippei DSM 8344]